MGTYLGTYFSSMMAAAEVAQMNETVCVGGWMEEGLHLFYFITREWQAQAVQSTN